MDPIGLLIFILIIAIIVISAVGSFVLHKRKKEHEKREEEFTNLLLNAFTNQAISGVGDLLSFYNAHFAKELPTIEVYKKLYYFLEVVLFRISSANNIPLSKLKNRLPEVRELLENTIAILKTEEKRVPFYGTPASERELLEDILELTTSDKEIVNSKLTRLAELIKARQETINTLGEEKGKARRLSLWGLAGTIIFGLLSVILGICTLTR